MDSEIFSTAISQSQSQSQPSPEDAEPVPADENSNITLMKLNPLTGENSIEKEINNDDDDDGDGNHEANTQNNNINDDEGAEESTPSCTQKQANDYETDETGMFTLASDVILNIDDADNEATNIGNGVPDSQTDEEANDEVSCEYNEFSAEYGEAVADGFEYSENCQLPKSFLMPFSETRDPTLSGYIMNGSHMADDDPQVISCDTEDCGNQDSDGMAHLDDLVVQSLAGSVPMQGINGIFYDNEAVDGEGMSDIIEDFPSGGGDHTYSRIPTISSRGIYGENDELLGFATASMDAGESPAIGQEDAEDAGTPSSPHLDPGSDAAQGKPLYSCDHMNVVCDQLSYMQIEDDQTVPSSETRPGALDDSIGSQNEDVSLMQQLHIALEDDRMVSMKKMLDELEPDVQADEASWLRLYDMLEKHHQDQLMYQCQQHDRRVNQIKSQITSEILLQRDSLQKRLANHQQALKTDRIASNTSYESPTRHSIIGQISPSKLCTPTLDKYEAKVSPGLQEPISENRTVMAPETQQRGTDSDTMPQSEKIDENAKESELSEREKQKRDLLSRFDLETPVMKALNFPIYSQFGAKDSGYQSPRTRSIFRKTGSRLSDVSDFVSPSLMYSKRESIEGERSKSCQGFYEQALPSPSVPRGSLAGRDNQVYHSVFLDEGHSNVDDFYDLPMKIHNIMRGEKLKNVPTPQADMPDASNNVVTKSSQNREFASPQEEEVEDSALNTTFTITDQEEGNSPKSHEVKSPNSEDEFPNAASKLDGESPMVPSDADIAAFDGFLPVQFSSSPSHDLPTSPQHGGREAVADHSHISSFSMVKDNGHSPPITDCSLHEEMEGGEEAVAETSHLSGMKLDGMGMYETDGDISVSSSMRMCHFLQDCCDVLEHKVDTLQRDNHEKQREIWQYEHKVDTLERKFNLSDIQRGTLETLVEKLNNHIKDRDAEILALQNDNRRLTRSLEASQQIFDDYEKVCREKRSLQSNLTSVESALYSAETEITGLVRQVNKLELENKRFIMELDSVRRSSLTSGSSSRIFGGSSHEISGATVIPTITHPVPPIVSTSSLPVGETEQFYHSVLSGSYRSEMGSQRSPSPLVQADQQLQRLKLAAEAHQASKRNTCERDEQHSAATNLLDVPKVDIRRITPINNASPPTRDSTVMNAPHGKPKRRQSLGKSPRRSLGAEFETVSLFAQSRVLREQHEATLSDKRSDGEEVDDSASKRSEDEMSDLDDTLTKVKSGVYRSMPEYEKTFAPSARHNRQSVSSLSSRDHTAESEKRSRKGSENTTKSLFSNSIEETVQHISNLEKRFDHLQMEKRRLETELSHIGKGPKAMRERECLESGLDKIDKELASIRMHLKKYNVL